MSGNDSSESNSSGSVLKSVINFFWYFWNNFVFIVLNNLYTHITVLNVTSLLY